MAEALAKMAGDGRLEAYSAGIEPGREANPAAVEVMKELGCDLSSHRPRHISAFQDIKFDFVAKMDTPDLGDLVHARWMENWDVPDPANGGVEEFRKVRDLLRSRIAALTKDKG